MSLLIEKKGNKQEVEAHAGETRMVHYAFIEIATNPAISAGHHR